MQAGVCSYCGVTEEQVDGDRLCWHDATRTCCSQYGCLKRHHAAARAAARAAAKEQPAELQPARYGDRYRGWGYGAIVKDLRRRGRRRRRAA